MKKIILLAVALCVGFVANAQVTTPQPSPSSKLEQTVGLTDISVAYSRPSKKGRTIFGDLVPYDKLWRTGANQNTIITFSDDVMIGGTKVAAGSYAIYSTPSKKAWEIYIYNDITNWGTPKEFDKSKVVATVSAEVMEIPFEIETFTIDISNITNDSADIEFFWSNVYVAFPVKTYTKEKVTASIKETMKGSPKAQDYYSAAAYYYQEGINIKDAKDYITKAIEMNEEAPFWMLRMKSLIYAKAGDKKGAIAAAKLSLEGAKKAGNADYVKMNEDSLKEWGAK